MKYILSLPFLGIYYVVGFILGILNYEFIGLFYVLSPIIWVLKYVSLGCYYTTYGIFYPLIYIYNKIIDILYEKKKKEIDLNMVAPYEVSEPTPKIIIEEDKEPEEEKPLTFEEKMKQLWRNFFLVKYFREKEENQVRQLLLEIQREKYRSERPVAFKYVAKDEHGKKITNVFIGFSRMEVLTYLTNDNYKVLSITTSKLINLMYSPDSQFQAKLKTKDLIFWLTQLSTYLKSGIPLTEAMRVLSKQMSKDKNKKRVFDSIIYNLTLGETFSSSLEKQVKTFPALLISMIKTAEATGELEATLDDMRDYYTEIENTRKAMVSALTYPTIVLVFAIVVIIFIMLYVLPQFNSIYASAGAELNVLTKFLLDASAYLQVNIYKILLIIVFLILALIVCYKKIKIFRRNAQDLFMHIPVFGKIMIYKEVNIFAKTFASLLKNNVFITDSIKLLTEVTNNEIYKEIMIKTVENIAKGDKISESFKDQWAVPDVAYYMIVTGESTGELGEMMDKVATYYQTEHKSLVDGLKSIIEPVMIIFLAVTVGTIVLAIILPMFELYGQIGW